MLIVGLAPSVFAQSPEIYDDQSEGSGLFLPSSHDNEVYNNGPPNAGGIEVERFVIADDFVLDETTFITDLHFQTFEQVDDTWDGTLEYFILDDAGGVPGAVKITGNAINVQKMNIAGTNYEYSADLEVPIELDGGVTYWIGIHLAANYDDQPIDLFIAMTDQIDGSTMYAAGDENLNWFASVGLDLAFILTGDTLVGGELLPIDSTSLILAGLQTSAVWMLPIVAGAVGTTAFYLKMRKN